MIDACTRDGSTTSTVIGAWHGSDLQSQDWKAGWLRSSLRMRRRDPLAIPRSTRRRLSEVAEPIKLRDRSNFVHDFRHLLDALLRLLGQHSLKQVVELRRRIRCAASLSDGIGASRCLSKIDMIVVPL